MELKIQGNSQTSALTYLAVGSQNQIAIEIQAVDVRLKAIALQDDRLTLMLEGRLTQASVQPLTAEVKPAPPAETNTAESAGSMPLTPELAAAPASAVTPPSSEKEENTAAVAPKVEMPEKRYGEPQPEIEAAPWQETLKPAAVQRSPAEEQIEPLLESEPMPASPPLPMAEEDAKREEIFERMREASRGHILPRLTEADMAAEKAPGQIAIRYQCPKCGTPGVQPPERLGAIVTCNKCGKAMRLTAKR